MSFFYFSCREPKRCRLDFDALSVGSSMELGGHCLVKPFCFHKFNLEMQGCASEARLSIQIEFRGDCFAPLLMERSNVTILSKLKKKIKDYKIDF